MANNDFFLRFGSDAADFSGTVSKDLEPAISSIYRLAQALKDYDQQAAESAQHPSNPVANTLSELDRAATEFRQLGSELASTFQETLRTTAGLATELKSLVDTLNSIPAKNKRITETLAANKINAVTPEDVKAAEQKKTLQGTADVLAVNADAAQKQLARVANVNATIARNANESATALQGLGKNLREVLAIAKDRGKALVAAQESIKTAGGTGEIRIGNTTADPVPVRVVGGDLDSVGHAGGPVTRPTTGSTPVPEHGVPGVSPVTGAPLTHHTVSDREREAINAADEAKRLAAGEPLRRLPTDIAEPRTTVQLPTGRPYYVGGGAHEGETIEEYRSRVSGLKKRETALYKTLPALSPEDEDLFKKFTKSGGSLLPDLLREIRNRPGLGAVPPVAANLDIARAQGIKDYGALKPEQMKDLPGLVQRLNEVSAKRIEAFDKFVQEEIARDPTATVDRLKGETKAAFTRYDREVVEGVGARVNPAKTVGEETSFRSSLAFTPEERAGAENRRRLAETGQESILVKEAKDAVAKAEERLAKREKKRLESLADLEDIQFNTSLTAEADTRRGAVGTSSARVANTREVLETLAATRPHKPEEMAEARRLVAENAQTVVGELQGKISRKDQFIKGRQATPNYPEEKINPHQRQLVELQAELAQFTAPKSYADVEHDQKAAEKARKQAEEAAQSNAAKLAASQAQLEAHRAVPPEHIRVTTAGELGNREEYAETTAALESAIREAQEQTGSLARELQFAKQEAARLKQERDALQARAKEAGFGGGATGARKHELAQLTSVAEALHARRTESLVQAVTGAPIPELERPEFRPGLPPEVDSEANRVTQLAEVKASINRITDRIRSRNRRDEAKGATPRGGTAEETAQLANLQAQVDILRQTVEEVVAPKPATAGGGGGRRPPTPPPTPAAGSNPEPEPEPVPAASGKGGRYAAEIAALDEDTRALLANTKARIQRFPSTAERNALVEQAAQKFRSDPTVTGGGPGFTSAQAQREVFARALGLTPSRDRGLVSRVLPEPEVGAPQAGLTDAAARAAEHAARMDDIYAESSERVRIALMAEYKAELDLIAVRERKGRTDAEVLGKEATLERASLGVANAREREAREAQAAQPKTLRQKLGISADNQLRHIGLGVENIVGYSLVFTGFEKLREVVHTGIETDAVFVRLQASLDASGRSVGHLRTQISSISADTATPMQHVVEAASELSGVFQNTADLAFGTKIASQLANISQGTLTAKEAAVGLRNVTAAYGITGQKDIQAVGDQIARLSQLTGVSVKDITEGTTQIAQTAHEFGLSQNQASVLAAYVAQGTGETGEQSAAQTSRLLGTLYKGNVQTALVRTGVATREQFSSGDIAGVLTNLITKYKTLDEAQKGTIAGLMGQGMQERAFAAIVNIGTNGLALYNNQLSAQGALGRQNAAYLATAAGAIKQLDENFQNLGGTLARLGAFDFLGLLAKSLNFVLHEVNDLGNKLADLFGGTRITTGILHITTTLLEAVVAFRLFGGVAATGLGKLGLRTATNASEIAAAKALNTANISEGIAAGAVPAATYRRLSLPGAAAVGERWGAFSTRFAGTYRAEREAAQVSRGLSTGGSVVNEAGAAASLANLRSSLTGLRAASVEALAGIGPLVLSLVALGTVAYVAYELWKQNQDRNKNESATQALASGSDLTDTALAQVNANQAKTHKKSFLDRVKDVNNWFSIGLDDPTQPKESYGKISGKSQKALDKLTKEKQDQLNQALGTGDADKIQAARDEIDKSIVANERGIKNLGGNDKDAQTSVLARMFALRKSLEEQATNRLKVLQGIKDIDALNQQQILALSDFVGQTSNLNADTLGKFKGAVSSYFDDTGISPTSGPGKDLLGSVDADQSFQQRATHRRDALASAIAQEQIALKNSKLLPAGSQQRDDAEKKLQADLQAYQTAQQQVLQAPVAAGTGAATLYESQGQYKDAASQLQTANDALQVYADSIRNDDPQTYWATLKTIQDNRVKIAELLGTSTLQGLELLGAGLTDPVAKAKNALDIANQQLLEASGTPGEVSYSPHGGRTQAPNVGVDAAKQFAAQQAQKAANLGIAAAGEALTEAQVQQQNAGIRNTAQKAQADLNETLRQQQYYADAKHRDDTKMAQLKAQEVQNRIAIADANNADALAVYDATAALDRLHGDATGAAAAGLAKAWADYNYQVGQFGATSAQAQQALANAYSAQQTANAAELDQLNSGLDLQIARLQTRGDVVGAAQATAQKAQNALNAYLARGGQTGTAEYNKLLADAENASKQLSDARLERLNSALDLQIAQLTARGALGDDVRAASLALQKAQNALAAYRARGGQSGTAESNKLLADVATAQRTAFDTALQAQLDTLDFQRETYKITSSQEVQALQEILKNKQLTLKEQRDITLKIKNLQQSIRDQLTTGGLNIPSDIKLPTAYEVRRSLGAGFGGAATQVNTVNNQQRTSIQITNTVPTAQVAAQIASQVISLINQQTGQQLRANSSTPRLVTTR